MTASDLNSGKPILAILLAYHNRKEMTLGCISGLEALFSRDWHLEYYLADDGSVDGTTEALTKLGLRSHFSIGDGSWYWAKSMARAEGLVNSNPAAILWINDDVVLDSKAGTSDFLLNHINGDSVLVGILLSSLDKSVITYGPVKLSPKHPLQIESQAYNYISANSYDSFNGNFVFIPEHIWKTVGKIDGQYSHAYADFDYGIRVKRLGFEIAAIPFPVGICDRNPEVNLTAKSLFRSWNHPKILPVSSNLRFLKKHGGSFWMALMVRYFAGIAKKIIVKP